MSDTITEHKKQFRSQPAAFNLINQMEDELSDLWCSFTTLRSELESSLDLLLSTGLRSAEVNDVRGKLAVSLSEAGPLSEHVSRIVDKHRTPTHPPSTKKKRRNAQTAKKKPRWEEPVH